MSSTVGNSPTTASYPATETAKQDNEKFMEQVAPVVPPAVKAARELEAQEAKREKEDAQRQTLMGGAQSFGESFGADDEESAKALHGIKVGAHKAGLVVSDKALATVHAATKDDPGTQKLVQKLADPNDADTQKMLHDLQTTGKADVSMAANAYLASPAASLPAADADVSANAAGTGTAADASPGASATAQASAANRGAGVGTNTGATGASGAGTALAGSDDGARTVNSGGLGSTPSAAAQAAGQGASAPAKASGKVAPDSAPPGQKTGPGHIGGGNWSAYIAMAMFKATKELQIEKKNDLNEIKKFNSMLDQVNKYVTDVLMPAQQELQSRVANSKAKGDDLSKMEVTIYGAINPDTKNANWDPVTGTAILLNAPGSPEPPPAQKVTQVTLSAMIDNANTFRTSISNNQQLKSSDYQSRDTQLTSFLNMTTTFLKNVGDTVSAIVRNLPT